MYDTIEFDNESGFITDILNDPQMQSFTYVPNDTPMLVIDNQMVYPGLPQPVKVTDEKVYEQIESHLATGEPFMLALAKDDGAGDKVRDYYPYGVVCKVAKILHGPDDEPMVFLMPGFPAKITKIKKKDFPHRVCIKVLPPYQPADYNDVEFGLLCANVTNAYKAVLNYLEPETRENIWNQAERLQDNIAVWVYYMLIHSPLTSEEANILLSYDDNKKFLETFLVLLDGALQKLKIQADIHMRTHQEMDKEQRRQFLEEQLRNIKKELDGDDAGLSDDDELRERARNMVWGKDANNHFLKELKKLGRLNVNSPDYSVQYSYLDTLLNLPWGKYSTDNFSLSKVEKILERDHYGLEKVKERIIEQMAVLKLRQDMKAPILCLYGPPGVGKTSLGRSIADALGREYARVSLGGLHDEAEIRGHRKTYIGAMPGRILSALAKCGTGNPVFVLDEIDKIGKDFKGDPSTALLEVLDPEQNSKFHDNFVDFDYDLSKILFIATANSLNEISRPLLDRMEVIEISGYIPDEKVQIAKRHLLPKSLEEHGLKDSGITITEKGIRTIIDNYTRESGVRQLEKKIANILRKLARLKASGQEVPSVIDENKVRELLGKEEVRPELYEDNSFAGVVTGLAWTQTGGEILFIESSLSPGNGEKLTLTGNLGDVMKESAIIAMQYLKAHAGKIGINPELFAKYNVHVHVPEGAIPKDGPSAGVTMATSLASSFTGRAVRPNLAMTGEITLRGKVLPVGGIKEKMLAAKRAGITDVILSEDNRRDIEEINARYLKGLTFHYVKTVDQVLDQALLPELATNHFDLTN